MAGFDWAPYLVGGAAARPDSVTGLDMQMQDRLAQMFSAAPPDIQAALRVTSGYRSPQVQERLWNEALAKYGSPEAARKWVAPPGRSNHNHGTASDLKYLDPRAQDWAHQNATNFGLAFPLSNEPWHVELAEARGGAAPALPAGGTGGLSYGVAQPNVQTGPGAYQQIAAMFGGAAPTPAIVVEEPAATPQASRRVAQAEREKLDQDRRQALFAGIGSFFG